jgi:hypothetical protein
MIVSFCSMRSDSDSYVARTYGTRRPEGLDWVQREIINDCGQLGPWDAPSRPNRPGDAAGGGGSDDDEAELLLSDSEAEDDDEAEALLDDPLALAVVGAPPPLPPPSKKKNVPGTSGGKRGENPCLGLLQRVTLCPRHESGGCCGKRKRSFSARYFLMAQDDLPRHARDKRNETLSRGRSIRTCCTQAAQRDWMRQR